MNKLIKSLSEIFMQTSAEPIGLCSFEHSKETNNQTSAAKQKRKREVRLSELME